ncbi:MAG TPA: hypothetical protein VGH94_03805 [Acidimicrobiales bacterium]|jgi:hypothetical protein
MTERDPLKRAEELAEEAEQLNPDETTRREVLELELDEEDLSEEGTVIEVEDPSANP